MKLRPALNLIRAIVLCAVAIACALSAAAGLGGAYYGTNYTVPFAHAYRALDRLGVDHRTAIDRDTYHMSRLGLNAFRLHLWDVELSDAEGNLLQNDHLDLLDYLIASVEKRGISVLLTAQTNFGNGYPERNTDPNGAYSYDYDKCRVHDTPAAADAQERYLRALAAHVNPYTGKSYADDASIIAIEINNEPCHSGTHDDITAYINRMAGALRESGWNKDILYNVSHNLWRTSAFFRADIDGTTYQWYPTGLVHGSTRQGNFLPVLDDYHIPFDTVAGFDKAPRVIYEFDPADVTDTYLFPAAARTFRKHGFEWITQFAYDPIDMARFNTEYQTHFLNLAYTPGKAIGMAIAAEVTRRTPMFKDYGKYPVDTVFGDFTVSARRNLAMLNDGEKFYHTNTTADAPKNLKKLKAVAAVGSSPIVATDGTGAYFLDRLDKDTWRLELMPDVVLTADPFARPSLSRTVAEIIDAPVTMTIDLPGLPEGFHYKGRTEGTADGRTAVLMPGVYLLGADTGKMSRYKDTDTYADGTRQIGEYAMPPVSEHIAPKVIHTPAASVPAGKPFEIKATVVSSTPVDSVVIFPADVDFWRNDNRTLTMRPSGKYDFSATVDHTGIKDCERYDYSIVVYAGGKAVTFPSEEPGAPLDWDFGAGRRSARPERSYSTRIAGSGAPVLLYDARGGYDATDSEPSTISKYVRDIVACHPELGNDRKLVLTTGATGDATHVCVGLVTADGFTYGARVPVAPDSRSEIALDSLVLTDTYLMPEPFPSFLNRTFSPDPATATPFRAADIESVVVHTDGHALPLTVDIRTISIE